jgi:hypothetical protein
MASRTICLADERADAVARQGRRSYDIFRGSSLTPTRRHVAVKGVLSGRTATLPIVPDDDLWFSPLLKSARVVPREPEPLWEVRSLGLIRFRGHLPKGGYDVQADGRHPQTPAPPAIR